MRIIAGQRRGHKFDGPKGNSTRPTSDLVREALFNILGDSIADMMIVDLFAGTGALGLEALSRGASRALFVERNRDNVALIHRNVATLRYEDRARVVLGDAYRWAKGLAPVDDEPICVFLDPPYREFEANPRKVNQLLEDLVRNLPEGSILAFESSRTLDEQLLPGLPSWDVRRYGRTQVAIRFLSRQGEPGPSTSPSPPAEPL